VFRDALAELEAAGDDPAAWQAWLAEGGYTHVLVSDVDLAFSAEYLPPATYARRRDILQRLEAENLTLLFADRGVRAYAVRAVRANG
jgi:hypothetical protein